MILKGERRASGRARSVCALAHMRPKVGGNLENEARTKGSSGSFHTVFVLGDEKSAPR